MSALAWLAIPLIALLLGVLWAMWVARPRPRADTHETVEEHARFRAALAPRHLRDRKEPEPPDDASSGH